VERYRERISGPLLDRINLRVEVLAVRFTESAAGRGGADRAV
jgi:predicted ATPase with chaperone activity